MGARDRGLLTAIGFDRVRIRREEILRVIEDMVKAQFGPWSKIGS